MTDRRARHGEVQEAMAFNRSTSTVHISSCGTAFYALVLFFDAEVTLAHGNGKVRGACKACQ